MNKIYSRDVFEKYVNFQNHHLSHCGVTVYLFKVLEVIYALSRTD
jgi:hypothetical protein